MVDMLVRIAINAIALIIAIKLVPHLREPNELWALIAVALIFGVINAYLRPIVKLLSLPLNLLFFGLVGLIINTAMLLLLAVVSGQLKLGFAISGWPTKDFSIEVIVYALLAAIVISIVSAVLALIRLVVPRI